MNFKSFEIGWQVKQTLKYRYKKQIQTYCMCTSCIYMQQIFYQLKFLYFEFLIFLKLLHLISTFIKDYLPEEKQL